jgi:prepilin peptidase CpaA
MNMNLSYIVAIGVGVISCATDVRSRRIPNVLTFGAAIAGVMFHATWGHGVLFSMEGWAVATAAFILPFALGGLGAGDVKLLGALGAWLGPMNALWLSLYTGIAGGVLSVVVATYYGYLGQALSNVRLLVTHWQVCGIEPVHEISLEGSSGPRLAYALPIFAGLVLTLWLR